MSVEMLILLPVVFLCVNGILILFRAHLARQRTFAALPEISRKAVEEGHYLRGFSPHEGARCRIDGLSAVPHTGLSGKEIEACVEADYVPPSRLRRTGFRADTISRTPALPGLPRDIRTRTRFQTIQLVR